MHRSGSARPACVALVALVGLGLVGGCSRGDDSDSTSTSATSAAVSTSSAPSPSASETPSPTPSSTAPSATTSSAAPVPLRARLLGAADLPRLEPAHRWVEQQTSTREPAQLLGTCQKVPLASIGAERVVSRRFRTVTPADNQRAFQLVATFPDAATARRAYSVLESWRSDCKAKLSRFIRREVGRSESVTLPGAGAQAQWYLLVYAPVPDDMDVGYFDAEGSALVGNRLTMMGLVQTGQNYDYDPGREPMAVALEAAARRLG